MATKLTPRLLDDPPNRDDIDGDDLASDDTSTVAVEDTFADDTTRRAADEDEGAIGTPAGDNAPVLEDAAGADAEDVAAETGSKRRRR